MPKLKAAAGSLIALAMLTSTGAFAIDAARASHRPAIDHVLLISVDGLHALDVARFVKSHPESALAELAEHGVTYSNASTPANSDSFPGLLALVTGGSEVSHGVFYDASYDRTLYDPANTACTGQAGNAVAYDETIDRYTAANVSLNQLDPAKLPRGKDRNGNCVPVYPHSFVRANTIFEVARAHGLHTAWADKHPSYDLVNGPSGHGVEDLYTPEITNAGGFDATASVVCTVENDALKVAAVLNQIRGKRHDGTWLGHTPAIFGMNFQAVSVGQKLASDAAPANCNKVDGHRLQGKPGGYLDAAGTPTEVLNYGLEKTDAALKKMMDALKEQHLFETTLFIVTAKHGQSPIDPAKSNKPGHFGDLVAALPDASVDPAAMALHTAANCTTGPCGYIQDDDVAVIWLANSKDADAVAAYLKKNAKALFIDYVLSGDSLKLKFNNLARDSRTPDIIVQPIYGTVYTGSAKKNAEHGGFSFADTNVGLIVSNPWLSQRKIKTPVASSQVAPTIISVLGFDDESLDAVRIEHTEELPALFEQH